MDDGSPRFSLNVTVNTNSDAWVRVSKPRLCLLRRCSAVEQQRRMGVPESTEPTTWKAKLDEDRRQHVFNGQAIRRGTFGSVKELVAKIDHYVQNTNRPRATLRLDCHCGFDLR